MINSKHSISCTIPFTMDQRTIECHIPTPLCLVSMIARIAFNARIAQISEPFPHLNCFSFYFLVAQVPRLHNLMKWMNFYGYRKFLIANWIQKGSKASPAQHKRSLYLAAFHSLSSIHE